MEGSDIANQLPEHVRIMYQRIPQELRGELDTLPPAKVVSVLEALNRLHRAMEVEVYELALRLIQASR
jgi:hypothetical protein